MRHRAATFLVVWLALLVAILASCAPRPPVEAPQAKSAKASDTAVGVPTPESQIAAGEPEEAFVEDRDPGPIPVTQADPARGRRTALVTIVMFSDFECPFCKKVHTTLRALELRYGPDQLRIVWKNNPLPFHKNARPAAEAAMAVFEHQGPDAFWTFHDTLFEATDRLTPDLQDEALRRAGVNPRSLEQLLESGAAERKVDADIELAKQLGATGTPASFINGVFLSGAQPIDSFIMIIDEQLAAARALQAEGMPPARIYAALTRKNLAARPTPEEKEDSPDDTAVHLVPVGDSPVRGKATALVTLVLFSDFQCPFCARVVPTLEQLAADYGDDLRIVWKDNPLPFHPRAEPAAELAREARAQKGDAGFWRAHDLLYTNQRDLEDPSLENVAASMGLNVGAVKRAIQGHKHRAKIEADQELADDIEANGTPYFFVNGRRLVGAQPIDKFKSLIDEELVKAKALVAKGTPQAKVYETIQKQAVPPAGPQKVNVPAPGKASPRRGAANGKVVVQMFADFQCPFCAHVVPTVDQVISSFPGMVQVVWRNLPLPMHKNAMLAAEAAMEAFAQKGDAGFWKMHDLLFKDTSEHNLDRTALERHAGAIGLDLVKFRAALDNGTHRAAIEQDRQIAEAAGIDGTPGFVINGIFVSGAQPLVKFKKAVNQALAEMKTK